jgi:hypothetical protein
MLDKVTLWEVIQWLVPTLAIILSASTLFGQISSRDKRIWAAIEKEKENRQKVIEEERESRLVTIEKASKSFSDSIGVLQTGVDFNLRVLKDRMHEVELDIAKNYVSRNTLDEMESRFSKQLGGIMDEIRGTRKRLDDYIDRAEEKQ